MQLLNVTPAESLLHRLQQSEKCKNAYHFLIEKEEAYTSIFVQASTTTTTLSFATITTNKNLN